MCPSGTVQTVLGPISPAGLGITLPHEHLLIDASAYFAEPRDPAEKSLAYQPVTLANLNWVLHHLGENLDNTFITDEKTAVKEASLFRQCGGSTVVEATPIELGRNPQALARISQATGLNVVMGTGYHVAASSRTVLEHRPVETIAEEFVRDITVGAPGTEIRAGIIGELGCSHPLKDTEKKVLQAGAMAQQRTGAAVSVHPGRNENDPLEAISVLKEAGADLTRVTVCHMDRSGYLLETRRRLLDAGCYIEYDVFGYEGYYSIEGSLADGHLPDMPNDCGRAKEIKELIGLGYIRQLLLSHDVGAKTRLVTYGGCGYAHLVRYAVPLMKVYGITQQQIDVMMQENPRRLLTMPGPA